MGKMFARGNHVGGGQPPSAAIPNTQDGHVQAKGQFGNPSGSTVTSKRRQKDNPRYRDSSKGYSGDGP